MLLVQAYTKVSIFVMINHCIPMINTGCYAWKFIAATTEIPVVLGY